MHVTKAECEAMLQDALDGQVQIAQRLVARGDNQSAAGYTHTAIVLTNLMVAMGITPKETVSA